MTAILPETAQGAERDLAARAARVRSRGDARSRAGSRAPLRDRARLGARSGALRGRASPSRGGRVGRVARPRRATEASLVRSGDRERLVLEQRRPPAVTASHRRHAHDRDRDLSDERGLPAGISAARHPFRRVEHRRLADPFGRPAPSAAADRIPGRRGERRCGAARRRASVRLSRLGACIRGQLVGGLPGSLYSSLSASDGPHTRRFDQRVPVGRGGPGGKPIRTGDRSDRVADCTTHCATRDPPSLFPTSDAADGAQACPCGRRLRPAVHDRRIGAQALQAGLSAVTGSFILGT